VQGICCWRIRAREGVWCTWQPEEQNSGEGLPERDRGGQAAKYPFRQRMCLRAISCTRAMATPTYRRTERDIGREGVIIRGTSACGRHRERPIKRTVTQDSAERRAEVCSVAHPKGERRTCVRARRCSEDTRQAAHPLEGSTEDLQPGTSDCGDSGSYSDCSTTCTKRVADHHTITNDEGNNQGSTQDDFDRST
jgi:hypothetical protein